MMRAVQAQCDRSATNVSPVRAQYEGGRAGQIFDHNVIAMGLIACVTGVLVAYMYMYVFYLNPS